MEQTKKKTNRDTLTAEDLKGNIFKSLQESGVYDELKSHLRQSMVNDLMAKNRIAGKTLKDGKSNLLAATIHQKAGVSWTQRALDNLVLHHIKRSKYHYTMSLFQQESGLKKYSKSLTIELLTKLGLKPNNLTSKSFASSADSSVASSLSSSTPHSETQSHWMLWDIMEALSNHQNSGICKKSFESTPIKKNLTLADKLLAVDQEFTKHAENLGTESRGSMMTTLNTAIQQAEKETERRYKLQLEQWKMYELTKVRTEEAEKAKRMMNQRIEQIEKDYAEQKKALLNRERMAVERLSNHRKSLEAELHIQRQKLLQEMEGLKSREELIEQQEKHIRKMETMRMKELDMLKAATIKGVQSDSNEPQLQFQSGMNDILIAQLDSMCKENNKLKSELSKLQEIQHQVDDAIQHPSSAQKSPPDDFYVSQNERLRTRIEELENAISELKTERPQQHLEGSLRQEVDDLKKMKNEQEFRQCHLEEMIRKMRDTIDQNTKAMRGNLQMSPPRQHKYSPRTTPLRAITQQKTVEFQPEIRTGHHLASTEQKVDPRDYEAISKDILLADRYTCPTLYANAANEERPMFKTCCTKERVKFLGEQSDALQRELEKYNECDFERKLTETKRKFFSATDGNDGYQNSLKEGYGWGKKSVDSNPKEELHELSVLNEKQPPFTKEVADVHHDEVKSVEGTSPRELKRRRRSRLCSKSSIESDRNLETKEAAVSEMEKILKHEDDEHPTELPASPTAGHTNKEEKSLKATGVFDKSGSKKDDNQHHSYHSISSESSRLSFPDDETISSDNLSSDQSVGRNLPSIDNMSDKGKLIHSARSLSSASSRISNDRGRRLDKGSSPPGRKRSRSGSLIREVFSKSSASSVDEISLLERSTSIKISDDNSAPKLNLKDLETRAKSPSVPLDNPAAVEDEKKEDETSLSAKELKKADDLKDDTAAGENTGGANNTAASTNTDDASSSDSFTSCAFVDHKSAQKSSFDEGDVFERSSKSPISLESANEFKDDSFDDSW